MKNNKKEKVVKILSIEEIDDINSAIVNFKNSDYDEHYMNKDTIELIIYDSGKMELFAEFTTHNTIVINSKST